ncbi:MAG: hypothetical protein HRU15_09805 [Planctomycetes bacterium]|nr:hypothetical protein [Planctomycetota bacterium]
MKSHGFCLILCYALIASISASEHAAVYIVDHYGENQSICIEFEENIEKSIIKIDRTSNW